MKHPIQPYDLIDAARMQENADFIHYHLPANWHFKLNVVSSGPSSRMVASPLGPDAECKTRTYKNADSAIQ